MLDCIPDYLSVARQWTYGEFTVVRVGIPVMESGDQRYGWLAPWVIAS